jgi:ParB-like chromosome segregation protein Spo0J
MLIPLEQLAAHPANANVMPADLLAKLQAHIRATDRYPPLIVRPHGEGFQILDGHHRAVVLRRLGHTHAQCDVWRDIDDRQAAMLLLTLNRLHGADDPLRRGALLAELTREADLTPAALAKLLPDNLERIEKLIDLASPIDRAAIVDDADVPDRAAMPQAVTFFLTDVQRAAVLARLQAIDRDRSVALVKALGVEEPCA